MQKFCSVTLFIFLTLPNLSFSQKNAIFGEIGGNAIFYSLNYERKISKEDNKDIYLKIGLSLLGNKTANFTYTGVDKSVNIPLMLNFVKK